MEDYELYDGDYEYEDDEYLDEYPEDDSYENWDDLECGFNPYMGCYDYDC